MQTVYVITTGGTIEKEYSEKVGSLVNESGRIAPFIGRLRLPDLAVEIVPLINKDSLEITPEDLAALVAEVERLHRTGCSIVITHGTDTMVASGLEIQHMLPDLSVPVILTGSMIPLGIEGSDGLQNLTESLFAARILRPGVHVVFHGQVFPVSEAQKDMTRGTFAHRLL